MTTKSTGRSNNSVNNKSSNSSNKNINNNNASSSRPKAQSSRAAIDVPGIYDHVRRIVLPWWERRHDRDRSRQQQSQQRPVRPPSDTERQRQDMLPSWAHDMIFDTVHLVLKERKAERKLNLRRPDSRGAAADHGKSEVDACLCAYGLQAAPRRGGKGAATAVEEIGSGFSGGTVYRIDARTCAGTGAGVAGEKSSTPSKDRADNSDNDNMVAVKVTEIEKDLQSLEHWKREAKIARKAGELGVGPRVRDAFVCQRANRAMFGFIVMDLIRGTSLMDVGRELRQRARREGGRPSSFSLRSMMGMLDAALVEKLQNMFDQKRRRLNDAGIVHGDLGPANLIIVPNHAAATTKKGRRGGGSGGSAGGDAVFVPGGPEDVADVAIINYGMSTMMMRATKKRRDHEKKEGEGRDEDQDQDTGGGTERYARTDPFFWEEMGIFAFNGDPEEQRAIEELVEHVRDRLVAEGVVVPWAPWN